MVKIDIEKKLNMAEGWQSLAVNLNLKPQEFMTIFGKSGAGKTTLLRMIAGLSSPDKGLIQTTDQIWFCSSQKRHVPVQKRNIGFVFQNLALFPNMTILENLQYAAGKNLDKPYLKKLLQITELTNMSHRKPQFLSGGQQQRVALIRALARKPNLLLLDEPFSSLDIPMRRQLRKELLDFHHEFQLTTILVSHDIAEIGRVTNRLIEIKNGRQVEHEKIQVLNSKMLKGKIKKVTETKFGFVVEVLIEKEILRLPIAKITASQLKENAFVHISTDTRGGFQLHLP